MALVSPIEQITDRSDISDLARARQRFAEMWFNPAADENGVTECMVDYFNALSDEGFEGTHALPTFSDVACEIYLEAEAVANYAPHFRNPMTVIDTERVFYSYMSDETATALAENNISAIPRAFMLTLTEQLNSML